MNLIEILKNLPLRFSESNENLNISLRVLEPIVFGDHDYYVSIQASQYHYCLPRETLDISEYTHFEVMLHIPTVDMPIEWENFNYYGDDVFGYVPIHAIERLIYDLDKKYKMIKK